MVVFAFGLALIYIGNGPAWPGWLAKLSGTHLPVVAEVGIAFMIASIVTWVYEKHARERFTKTTVEDVLAKVMGDVVSPGIWREMREQLLSKVAVRKNTTVRLRLYRPDGLENGRCVLALALEYQLTSLRSNQQKVKVFHFVDAFMNDPKLGLPRLIRVEIDGQAKPLPDGEAFEEEVAVAGRDGAARLVHVEREELVYVPGAYNLLMSELTELELIALHQVPDDICVTVNCFFDPKELTTQKAIRPGRYLLPGQSVEVRFEKRLAARGA
jgi:hypothetical protein